MADTKISDLGAAATLDGTELVPVVQSGATVQTTAQDIADLAPSGTSVTGYFADMPPSSPHANDDEFSDASVGGAWTEWDVGSKVTVTEGTYGLKLAHVSSSGANNYGGIYRAIPAGDFTVITKMSHSLTTSGAVAGVFVAADLGAAPSTADFHVLVHGLSSLETNMGVHLYNDYTSFNSTINTGAYGPTHAYLRIRRVSTLFSMDYSTDGVGWYRAGTFTPGYTAAHIGLTINNSTTVASSATFRFWRQSSDTNLDTPVLGRVL